MRYSLAKKPNVKHLKIYGSRVFVRVPEAMRKNKWDDKAKLGILVGYNDNSYRVLVNNRIINARHVKVVEEGTELICLKKTNDNENRTLDDDNFINLNLENEINENDNESDNELNRNDVDEEDEFNNDTDNEAEQINESNDLQNKNGSPIEKSF